MPAYQTALDKLKALWGRHAYRQALKLAAGWPRLGEHKEAITRGWAATSNPHLYSEMGSDPDALYRAGVEAVSTRYGLPAPVAGEEDLRHRAWAGEAPAVPGY